MIVCKCGCGSLIQDKNKNGPLYWKKGHNMNGVHRAKTSCSFTIKSTNLTAMNDLKAQLLLYESFIKTKGLEEEFNGRGYAF